MNLVKDYSYGYPSSTTSMNQEFARARLQQRTVCVRLRCGDGHLARWCYMMHLWCYMYDTSWLQEQHLLIPKLTHTWIGTPFPPRPIFMPPLAALTGSWGSWQNVGDQESTRVHVLFGNDDVGPPWFTLLRSQNHQTGGFFGWPFLQIPRYQHTNIPRYQDTGYQDTRLARWVAACGMSQWTRRSSSQPLESQYSQGLTIRKRYVDVHYSNY